MKRPGHHQMLGLSVGDKCFTFRTPKRIMSSLIWGKMKTVAWDTAFQIALRNCSRKAAGKTSIYVIWVKGQYLQSGTYILQKVSASLVKVNARHEEQTSPWRISVLFYIWEDARIGLIKSAPENIYLKTCPSSFSQSTEYLISALHPELLSQGVENQRLQKHMI